MSKWFCGAASVWIAAMAVSLLVVAPAIAQEQELIDRVVALVDDEAIFQSDVETAVRQYMFQRGTTSIKPEEREALYNEALQTLIDDRLVIAQAARLGIDVPFSDVEAQVNKTLEENRKALGGDAEFERQLAVEGLTLEDLKKLYRTQLRNRMLVERVLQKDMKRQQGDVTEEELRAFYERNIENIPKRPEVVHLKTIFVGFESSSKAVAVARDKANAIRMRLINGEDFAEVAKAESEDPSAALGGELGWVRPQDLREPAFAKAVESMDAGQISEPVLTVYGYHIIEVTDKRPQSGEVQIRHILVRSAPSDEDIQVVFASANAIRDELTAGAVFDSLAARYNTDPAADKYGDLGWLKVSELPQFFRDVLADMKPGDVSPVLRESSGFRIVELIEREEERPYKYTEIIDDLTRLYEQDRFGNTYQAYIEELRKKFNVEIRT
ncbi:MAG: peptidylprolyl isomerase [Candidatus Krumholzibacteria bacterium]|nr:peptidylprolyl isomerase [Candidatus Krumholzibacteria bacterium]MDH4336725.1 peptidylprolyl isomerase [Candidatus Krumholzibacteria bacterium]